MKRPTMEKLPFHTNKTIGLLLIIGGVLLLIPYTILSMTFEYPDILRQDTGIVLTRFHEGGSSLIWTWWAFGVVGLPLLGAYILIGQKLENTVSYVRLATSIGVIGLVVQMVGLLRWTFVVPVLAHNYMTGDAMTKAASVVSFQLIHQFGGVLLGEHLGQLFSIAWTVMLTAAFVQLQLMPRWINVLGYVASGIYLLAQTELFATVMPGIPVVDLAGFIGSTLWLLWLILIGIQFIKMR
jgi:hypothetical protein